MQYPLEGQAFTSADAFVKAINKARQEHPKQWIAYIGTVAGKAVRLKSFGTGYLQILEVDGVKHAPPMDMNVTGWKAAIAEALA